MYELNPGDYFIRHGVDYFVVSTGLFVKFRDTINGNYHKVGGMSQEKVILCTKRYRVRVGRPLKTQLNYK